MPKLTSAVTVHSRTFAANAAHNRALATICEAGRRGRVRRAKRSRKRLTARGKLLPCERVERLIDLGSLFLEVGQLAAGGLDNDEAPEAPVHSSEEPDTPRRPALGQQAPR